MRHSVAIYAGAAALGHCLQQPSAVACGLLLLHQSALLADTCSCSCHQQHQTFDFCAFTQLTMLLDQQGQKMITSLLLLHNAHWANICSCACSYGSPYFFSFSEQADSNTIDLTVSLPQQCQRVLSTCVMR